MKLEDTKDKLEEAQFFLRHLTAAQNEQTAQPQIPFRYCLSAFLNAAYGVQQYLETEVVRALRQQALTSGKKLSNQQAGRLYAEHKEQWISDLPPGKKVLWDSMDNCRGAEAHEKRVSTVTTQKAVPLDHPSRFPYGTERSYAYAAWYVMQQNVAALYPDIAETVAKEGLPFGVGAWNYIAERHLEVGKALRSTVSACTEYVELLANLVAYFGPLVP